MDNAYRQEACRVSKKSTSGVSILVLLDNAYRPKIRRYPKARREGFQSLFFWIMPTGADARFREIVAISQVSILVLLDNAYRRLWSWQRSLVSGVSILVLLDNAYRPAKSNIFSSLPA